MSGELFECIANREDIVGGQGIAGLDGVQLHALELATALESDDPLRAWAGTFVRFATEHAALLDLMFAGKHASPELNAASDRCFSPAMALFDSEISGMVAFATLHGLASLLNRGLLPAESLDALLDEAVAQLAARAS